jgi:TPR repeat protein
MPTFFDAFTSPPAKPHALNRAHRLGVSPGIRTTHERRSTDWGIHPAKQDAFIGFCNSEMKMICFKFFALFFCLCLGGYAFAGDSEAEEIYQAAKPMIGQESPATSKQLGIALMREAAEKGHAKAQSIVGFQLANGDIIPKDIPSAIIYLQKAATSRDVFACRNLRVLSEGKTGADEAQRSQAWSALKAAADAGSLVAAAQVGEMFYFGCESIQPVDYHKAARYLEFASKNDDISSTNMLGMIYEQGFLGKANPSLAFSCFQKAAEAGHAKAQANLGFAYYGGKGTERDLVKAYQWFMLSSLQGEATGKNALGDFARGLSEVQRAEGNRLAAEYLEKQGKEVPDFLKSGAPAENLPL